MSRPTLIIATNNPGKVREFRALLDGCGFDLALPAEVGVTFEVEETGTTFEANARLKAEAASALTRLPALADDSGLEVDALDGRPGIFSARYAGGDRTDPALTDEERYRIVLDEMRHVQEGRRGARFRAVIAIAAPGRETRTVEGVFGGRIGNEPRGDGGFGYDPIFLVAGRDITSAELPEEEKNAMSHRGRAARKALPILKELARDPGA